MSEERTVALRGASKTMSELIDSDDVLRALLISDDPLPTRDGYASVISAELARDGFAAVRLEKRRRLIEIAARDLAGEIPLETVGRALADLTDACVGAAVEEAEAAADISVI